MLLLTDIKKLSNSDLTNLSNSLFGLPRPLSENLKNINHTEYQAIRLLKVKNSMDLCQLLDMRFETVTSLINQPIYKTYAIPKKKGGVRQIQAPDGLLKKAQKKLNFHLQHYYLYLKPDQSHGFVLNPNHKGDQCNIVSNARPHVNKKQVLNLDLKNFFPSIKAKRIYDLFASPLFEFDHRMATALTLLTTYESKLPTGAPTSPVLSNFACLLMDQQLQEYAAANQMEYTRYADDLTFSSNERIGTDHLKAIRQIIENADFTLNDKKARLRASNSQQVVTGIMVNKKVNMERKLYKKIRAMLHDYQTNGLDKATQKHYGLKESEICIFRNKFHNELAGYMSLIKQVRGKQDRLYQEFLLTIKKPDIRNLE